MNRRVYIVGMGARTALGNSALATAAAVWAGIARFREHPSWVDRFGEEVITAAASHIPLSVIGCARFSALGAPALAEALHSLQGRVDLARRIHLFLGLPLVRDTTALGLEAAVSRYYPSKGLDLYIRTFPRGHAAGLLALEEACRLLDGGEDLCLIGGIDTYIEHETLESLDWAGRLRSQGCRFGFVPGEGAGFCVLASESGLRRHRLQALAQVRSVGVAEESQECESLAPGTGQGLTSAVRQALARLPSGTKIHQVLNDLNGERRRVDEWGFTLARVGDRLLAPVYAPADSWGDVGAASAPLYLILASLWARRGWSRSSTMLVTSSEDGTRGAAVLEFDTVKGKASAWE